jgi:DNA-directed RNA polymerase subunit H (RpoH/RPB5)
MAAARAAASAAGVSADVDAGADAKAGGAPPAEPAPAPGHAVAGRQIYAPIAVVNTAAGPFLRSRGLTPAPRGLSASAVARAAYTDDAIMLDLENFGYLRIDALRAAPRGARDWVVIVVLAPGGKYATKGPDLRKLLYGIETERPAKDGRLDELIVLAPESFFSKKNMTSILDALRRGEVPGGRADRQGVAPYYSGYPFHNFVIDLSPPATVATPATATATAPAVAEAKINDADADTGADTECPVFRHEIMTAAEVETLLKDMRCTFADIPTIPLADAPIVWNGARVGDVVRITRVSETSGFVPYYRRVAKISMR